ncbi:hypothetical protein [Rhizobium leguminosarum]
MKMTSLAGDAGIDPRWLADYANGEGKKQKSIDVAKLGSLVEAFLRHQEIVEKKRKHPEVVKLLAELRELSEYSESSSFYDLSGMLLGNQRTGNADALRRLSGRYVVVRRVPAADRVMVTSLEIRYNERSNISEWVNVHRGNTVGLVEFGGVATEADAVFHFVGSIKDGSTLHFMSLMQPISNWNLLTGIVLTKTNRQVVASKVVVSKTTKSLENVVTQIGEMSIVDALTLANFPESLLNNTCDANSALFPQTDI